MSEAEKKGPGAPTVFTETVVRDLVSSFQDGLNVTQACWQSGIGRTTYYDEYNSNPEFADKMDRARDFASMNARKVIVNDIKRGDQSAAKWWLERRNKDEFSTRQEVTGRGGKPLVETLSQEERNTLDSVLMAKSNEKDVATNEASESVDPGVGGAEGQGIS